MNDVLDDPESKTLVQLIMSKLLSKHPYVEYSDLSAPPPATKARKKSKKSLQATYDVVNNNTSDEYEIDAQYQALPNSKKSTDYKGIYPAGGKF